MYEQIVGADIAIGGTDGTGWECRVIKEGGDLGGAEKDVNALTPKEERFCLEYTNDYNGTAAAKRAGYSEKSARVAASRLLKQPRIMERVRQLQKEQAERLCLSSDLIVLETLELYRKCTQAVPVTEWDYFEHKMVETGEYQLDSRGAVKCLELLGRHLGMFDKDSRGADESGPVFIRDDIGEDDDGDKDRDLPS